MIQIMAKLLQTKRRGESSHSGAALRMTVTRPTSMELIALYLLFLLNFISGTYARNDKGPENT